MAEQVVQQVKKWQELKTFKSNLILSYEEELLETAGGIKKAIHHFKGQPFFVTNSDIVWPNAGLVSFLNVLEQSYVPERQAFLMGFTPNKKEISSGYMLQKNGQVRKVKSAIYPVTYGCVSVAHPRAFDEVEETFTGLRVVWDKAIEKGQLYGVEADLEWIDMGTPEGLKKASEVVVSNTW